MGQVIHIFLHYIWLLSFQKSIPRAKHARPYFAHFWFKRPLVRVAYILRLKIAYRRALSKYKDKEKGRFFVFVSCKEKKDYSLCLKTLRGKSIIYFVGNHFSLFIFFCAGGKYCFAPIEGILWDSWKYLIFYSSIFYMVSLNTLIWSAMYCNIQTSQYFV